MVRSPCWPIKRNKFRLRYSIILASDMTFTGWCAQIPEVRYPDIILVLQAQQLDDAHSDTAEHDMPFCGFECLDDTLLLAAALYLCEQVGPAFPAVRSSLGTACVQKW